MSKTNAIKYLSQLGLIFQERCTKSFQRKLPLNQVSVYRLPNVAISTTKKLSALHSKTNYNYILFLKCMAVSYSKSQYRKASFKGSHSEVGLYSSTQKRYSDGSLVVGDIKFIVEVQESNLGTCPLTLGYGIYLLLLAVAPVGGVSQRVGNPLIYHSSYPHPPTHETRHGIQCKCGQ